MCVLDCLSNLDVDMISKTFLLCACYLVSYFILKELKSRNWILDIIHGAGNDLAWLICQAQNICLIIMLDTSYLSRKALK